MAESTGIAVTEEQEGANEPLVFSILHALAAANTSGRACISALPVLNETLRSIPKHRIRSNLKAVR